MFPKNLTVLKLADPSVLAKLTEEKLAEFEFLPCGTYDAVSAGFSHAYEGCFRFDHFNHSLLVLTVEKKPVPGSAVKLEVAKRAKQIETETGFPPNKSRRKALKDEVTDDLRARAIPVQTKYNIWLDHKAGRVCVAHTSNAVVDIVVQKLYMMCEATYDRFSWPGAASLTHWIKNDDTPLDLTLDDTITLLFPGEKGKTAKFSKADVNDDDIAVGLENGAEVMQVAATYDNAVSFKLSAGAAKLSGIKATTLTKDSYRADEKADRFQNDFYLMTSTLSKLISYLIELPAPGAEEEEGDE